MSANTSAPISAGSEAPYSLNTTYTDRRGFTVQVTLRGDDGADTVKRFDALLDWLLEHGAAPADKYGNAKPTTVGPQAAPPTNGHANGTAKATAPANGHDPALCPIHGVAMKRFERDGRSWYSHKTDDGKWCKGTARN